MCMTSPSESGHGGRFEPCDTYIKLLSEKSRLEGLCAGLEEGNKINQERIKRQDEQLVELGAEVDRLTSRRDELLKCSEVMTAKVEEYRAENAALRQENQLLRAENANLSMAHGPGNHTDWMLTRASKYEQLHKDLEALRQERDRLSEKLQAHERAVLSMFGAAESPDGRDILEDTNTAMEWWRERSRLYRLDRDRLAGIVEKADALANAVELVPGFMSVVSSVVQDVWQRYRVNDSGLHFNPDAVAEGIEVAAKAYQEARHG